VSCLPLYAHASNANVASIAPPAAAC
jgi:hypothetical protein